MISSPQSKRASASDAPFNCSVLFLFLRDLFSLRFLTLRMTGLLLPLLGAATGVFLFLLMLTAAFLEKRGK